eukprot:COSAG01_NODE_3019_length_6711_cov_12.281004_3_plen_92_part_00
MHKQLLAAAKRLGYDKEEAKLIASCNEQRHVEIAANHPIDRPSAQQQQEIEDRARNRGSSAHMSTAVPKGTHRILEKPVRGRSAGTIPRKI